MAYTKPIPKDRQPKKFDSGMKTLVEAERLTQIAFTLPSAALVGWFMGSWLDRHLHTSWLTFAGIIFGGFSGLYYVVRLVMGTKPPAAPPQTGAEAGQTGNKDPWADRDEKDPWEKKEENDER